MSKRPKRRALNPAAAAPDEAHRLPRSPAAQFLVVFLLAMVVRAAFFIEMRDSLFYQVLICDAWTYDQWAQRTAEGDWIGSEVFYQTPLYPYFLAVVYKIFGHSPWAVRIVQAVLGSLACAFLARAGSQFFDSRVGWVAGVAAALYAPALFFDGILQKASLDFFLMATLLWAVACCQVGRAPSSAAASPLGPAGWPWFTLAGVLTGLLILNRENAAVFAPVLAGWTAALCWRSAKRVLAGRLAALALGLALPLLPVGCRNYYVGGEFLLTTSQMGPNFYIGNNRRATGRYDSLRQHRGDPRFERHDARLLAEQDVGRPLSPSEVSQYWMGRALADIREDPARWLRLLAWKALLTFHSAEIVDGEGIRVHAHDSILLRTSFWTLHFGVLCPLGAMGAWWTRRERRKLAVLYALGLSFAAAVIVFYVFARYRYPLVPIVGLFAAAGAVELFERLRRRTPEALRELGVGAALALPVAVACNWPLPELYSDEASYLNLGTALMDLGRARDAVGPLERAVAIRPGFSATYNNLGLAKAALGEHEAARAHFQRALELSPDLAAAHVNLAQSLAKLGERSQAMDHARRALALDPLSEPALRLLGRLEIQAGEKASGMERLRRAVEVEPNSSGAHADLGVALLQTGQAAEAVRSLRRAVALNPNALDAANNLAWILATSPDETLRDPAEALTLAQRVSERFPNNPDFLDTLAAAQAAAGRFPEALAAIDKAIEGMGASNPRAAPLQERRAEYAAGRAYVDRPAPRP
jgi:tetratricopeptide (TPR) repeat protein